MAKKRNPLRWLAEEYLATPLAPSTTDERFAALEAELEALDRRIKALGESVARAHSYGDAT